MRTVWYTRQGAAGDVLEFGDQPEPRAGPGEVRVRLHASGVNPADIYRRSGSRYPMEGALVIPHSDGSGIVDQAGTGVDPTWLGQRVWVYNGQRGGRLHGTAAQYIALSVNLVAPLPSNTAFHAGACLGIPCMTAHRCVTLGGDLAGKVVLVSGGAGAVGHYAVQWAKRFGANVVTTVSSGQKAEHARRAGADLVLDYRSEDIGGRIRAYTHDAGVDHVVDVDFGGNLPVFWPLLASNGSIAFYATNGNPNPVLAAAEAMRRNISIHAVLLNSVPRAARRKAQADIVAWLGEGGMLHTVSSVHALPDCAAAHAQVESGRKLGTVVVDCTQL